MPAPAARGDLQAGRARRADVDDPVHPALASRRNREARPGIAGVLGIRGEPLQLKTLGVERRQDGEVPLGVVVNFSGIGDQGVYDFCEEQDIPIIMEIPYDRGIAELYSRGIPFVEARPEWRQRFISLYDRIREVAYL